MAEAKTLEEIIDLSLVRLVDDEGVTLGTGFIAGPDGAILTCDHVIGSRKHVTAVFSDGKQITIAPKPSDRFADVDLAVLPSTRRDLSPLPLITAGEAPTRFLAKGYQFQRRGLTSAVPVRGEITGHSRVTYQHGDYHYTLPVLTLNQGDLDEGISGGPLLEPDTGTVYGVVVAHLPESHDLGGFALALPDAGRQVPLLAELLKANDAACPRFGSRLNRRGAQVLCQTQVSQMLGRLERERLYLPKLYCQRAALEAHLARFQASDAQVLPIVGHAGVGKTTFLAHFASELSNKRPALLLRGLAIAQGESGVAGLIDDALREAKPVRWRMATTVEHLTSALEGAGQELWILLDALNEARVDTLALSDLWMPETIEWLLRTGTRLILTCRNEHWQVLAGRFPRELLPPEEPASYPPNETGSRAEDRREVQLGEFSDAEIESATELYELPFDSEERLLRHPLTLRLVWELVQETGRGELQERRLPYQGTIIDRLVTRVCERAAIRIGGRTPVARIRGTIDAIAAYMFAARRQDIPIGTFDERFGHASEWFDALLHEHVFVAAGDRYRFAFDDVGEYLQSAQIHERDLANPGKLLAEAAGGAAAPLRGIVAHAYARLGASGRQDQLRAAISELCTWIREDGDVYFAFDVARRLRFFDEAGELRRDLIAAAAAVHAEHSAIFYSADAEALALPVPVALQLVRLLLPEEGWYGWRAKDWQDPRRRRSNESVFASEHSLSHVVGFALKRDPGETIKILFSWLGDNTKLEGERNSEASISDFALACLFYGRDAGLEAICELAADTWPRNTDDLLKTLAEVEPESVLDLVVRWMDRRDRERVAASILLRMYYQPDGTPQIRGRVIGLLARLFNQGGEKQARYRAAAALANEATQRERMWPILREAYATHVAAVTAFSLWPFLNSYGNEVMKLFHNRLVTARPKDWETGGPAWDILTLLGEAATSLAQVRATVELLGSVLEIAPAFLSARTLEDILYRIDEETVHASGILDLCARLLGPEVDDASVDCLLYVAFPRGTKDYAASSALRELVASLEITEERFAAVTRHVAPACRMRGEEAYAWLAPLRAKIDRETSEECMLSAFAVQSLMSREEALNLLERDWRSAPEGTLGQLAQEYLAARNGGVHNLEAAKLAIQAKRAVSQQSSSASI